MTRSGSPKIGRNGMWITCRQALQYRSASRHSSTAPVPFFAPIPYMSQSSLLPDLPAGAVDLWQACAEQLAQELPEQQFNTWIRPLTARVSPAGDKVTLAVANRFKMDWIRAQYAAKITAALEAAAGRPVFLELALAPREPIARTITDCP